MKKRWLVKDRVKDKLFIETCQKAKSMAQAASMLGLHFNSFKRRAIELGCYQPNQAGIGIKKNNPKIPLEDIIHKNMHPHYQSFKLKKRLIRRGIKQNTCEKCGITKWQDKPLNMELHHLDGNRTNHHISNLMLLCPNCHSQTDTFRAKNRKEGKSIDGF